VLKGVGNWAFHRWLTRDYRPMFPRLPERTRLFHLFKTHQAWTQAFLAAPTVLGVIDTSGIELIHPIREGRSPQQIGRKGLSIGCARWLVGKGGSSTARETRVRPSGIWLPSAIPTAIP